MKLKKTVAAAAWIASSLSISTSAWAGFVWNETTPVGAGDSLATAEVVYNFANDSLDRIHGMLTATPPVGSPPIYQVDLYKIRIADFNSFSARTVDPSTAFDTALYLFNGSGNGVYMNDDNGVDLLSALGPDGLSSNGLYYLAIAFGGFVASDALSASLFEADGSATAGAGALASWSPGFDAQTESPYSYDIVLTGAGNAAPEPGSIALMLASGIAAWCTRRKPRSDTLQAASA
jgi:hypothetical protein